MSIALRLIHEADLQGSLRGRECRDLNDVFIDTPDEFLDVSFLLVDGLVFEVVGSLIVGSVLACSRHHGRELIINIRVQLKQLLKVFKVHQINILEVV